MTVVWRLQTDYAFGTLSAAAAIGDTSISSAAFASLGTSMTPTVVLPIVLHNPAAGTHEVVWVTAHTAAATSVTVVRGKEGTSAQAWPSGTQWICAPTAARDGVPALTAAAISAVSDGHIGMRALETDSSIIKQQTLSQGWQADVGMCRPNDIGATIAGGTVPSSVYPLVRAGALISSTPSGGAVTVTFPTAFPNGFIGGVAGSCDHNLWDGDVALDTGTATGCKLWPLPLPGGACSLFYIALGY